MLAPGTGQYGDSFIYDDMQINSHLKQALRKVLIEEACGNKHIHTLLEAPDQDRAFHIISKDATSNLIFQRVQTLEARLNLLPTRSVAKRVGHVIVDDIYLP